MIDASKLCGQGESVTIAIWFTNSSSGNSGAGTLQLIAAPGSAENMVSNLNAETCFNNNAICASVWEFTPTTSPCWIFPGFNCTTTGANVAGAINVFILINPVPSNAVTWVNARPPKDRIAELEKKLEAMILRSQQLDEITDDEEETPTPQVEEFTFLPPSEVLDFDKPDMSNTRFQSWMQEHGCTISVANTKLMWGAFVTSYNRERIRQISQKTEKSSKTS